MLTLYKFGPAWNTPDASPFCLKLETYLRMAGVEFSVKKGGQHLRHAPKGKMPFVDLDGERIGDSELIIARLKARFGDPLDGKLDDAQRALALLVQRTLDEHCYFALVYSRWIEAENWEAVREVFFKPVPGFLRNWIANGRRKRVETMLHAQGASRHRPAEMYQMAMDDLKAVITLLGEKPYFFGEEASSVDAVIFSYLANLLAPSPASPLHVHARSDERIQAYVDRIYSRYYPEWKR